MRRKIRVGRVISDKMDKTVVVAVEWRRAHPIYKKAVRRRTRFKAHDEQNSCRIGDLVRIVESRPLSKTKRWRVAEILSSVEIAEVQPEDITVDEDVPTAVTRRPEDEVPDEGTTAEAGPEEAEAAAVATTAEVADVEEEETVAEVAVEEEVEEDEGQEARAVAPDDAAAPEASETITLVDEGAPTAQGDADEAPADEAPAASDSASEEDQEDEEGKDEK